MCQGCSTTKATTAERGISDQNIWSLISMSPVADAPVADACLMTSPVAEWRHPGRWYLFRDHFVLVADVLLWRHVKTSTTKYFGLWYSKPVADSTFLLIIIFCLYSNIGSIYKVLILTNLNTKSRNFIQSLSFKYKHHTLNLFTTNFKYKVFYS